MKARVNLEDGSNLTEISPILTCIHNLTSLTDSSSLWDDETRQFHSLSLKQLKSGNDINQEDGFMFVVSLRDGSCVYTSDAIHDHLGYHEDMLPGQCIMSYLFQKDHITFANHLTQGLNACFIQGKRDNSHLVLNTFFCRIRAYNSLKQGYSVSDRKTQYKPFKITLHIKELVVDDLCVESSALAVKATATRVQSAYSAPEEIPAMTSFSTRHTASCHFSHVDASAIPYFGYLPQDMIGFSVFDFYHVDDLPQLKEIYEMVVQEHGASFRSKPYRFKVQNGCYIMLETEWSCFINPWSHKLEFVVGQHRVLKGPSDIDIFDPCEFEEPIPREIRKESFVIQKEIKTLLSQSIQSFEEKKSKRFCNKRKRDLAAFVYNCIDESLKGKTKAKAEFDDKSNSDPDSVVMGDISPYRELSDSIVSSETPPTMQQIRYQENIDRFFASQPKTHSDGSEESAKHEKPSSVEDSQGSCSGSGNGSGDTSASKAGQSLQTTYLENNQKLSDSNSSKCNISFTTGDSGYGKSTVKGNNNDPSVSQAGSSTQMWSKKSPNSYANNMEKFSPCQALTEESLSVHNRMSHKHLKQQQRKGKAGLATGPLKDPNWFQQKDAVTVKKKSIQTQTMNVTINSPADNIIKDSVAAEQANLGFRSGSEQKMTKQNLQDMSAPSTSIASPFLFPSTHCPPTPFYIPVMYMGSMPYYPQGQNIPAHWPFGPMPPMPPSAPSAETTTKTATVPDFQIPSYNPQNFQNDFFKSSAAVSKPGGFSTSLTATTTSVTTQTSQMFKNFITGGVTCSQTKACTSELKSRPTECDMLVDESESSSFTRSSSCQSGDKSDDISDYDLKQPFMRAARPGKPDLPQDIAYRYQMNVPSMDDVLKKDREMLHAMQQPDMVQQQLQMLQDERHADNEHKLKVDENDYCMTEEVMLGLATEEEVNEELEYREECILQFMCEDT